MKNISNLIRQFFTEIEQWESHHDPILSDLFNEKWERQHNPILNDLFDGKHEKFETACAECEAEYRTILIKYLSDEAYSKVQSVLPGCPSRFDPDRDEIIEPFYQHRGFTAVEFIKRWSGIEQRKRFLLKETDGKWLIYNYQRYNEEKNRWDKDYF